MTNAIDLFIANLKHPRTPEILALREIILSCDERIGENIKWNSPSFRMSEHFATFNLRAKEGVQVVLHLGVTPQPESTIREAISDPLAMLDWRSADRALVSFRDMSDIDVKRAAFAEIVSAWLPFV